MALTLEFETSFLMLKTYFYAIDISFDKTNFTCIWVNLSRFKMIIISGYIEDMKITQELLKKSAFAGLDTSSTEARFVEIH